MSSCNVNKSPIDLMTHAMDFGELTALVCGDWFKSKRSNVVWMIYWEISRSEKTANFHGRRWPREPVTITRGYWHQRKGGLFLNPVGLFPSGSYKGEWSSCECRHLFIHGTRAPSGSFRGTSVRTNRLGYSDLIAVKTRDFFGKTSARTFVTGGVLNSCCFRRDKYVVHSV